MNTYRFLRLRARRSRICGALIASLAALLVAPVTAHAQDVAGNTECGTATAAAIAASWTRDQALAAATNGVGSMYATALRSGDPATMAAWKALYAAAQANAMAATTTAKDLQSAADDTCSKVRKKIADSHVEYRGPVGMVNCSPIQILNGALDPGENPNSGRLANWTYDVYPTWQLHNGVGAIKPVTIAISDCHGGLVALPPIMPPTSDLTPPPGGCPPGAFWTNSAIVGCQPCPADKPASDGIVCRAAPPKAAQHDAPPPPVTVHRPPNPCNTPPTPVSVSHEEPPPTPVVISHEDPPAVAPASVSRPRTPGRRAARVAPRSGGPAMSGGGGIAIGVLLGGMRSGGGGGRRGGGGGGGNPCGHRR